MVPPRLVYGIMVVIGVLWLATEVTGGSNNVRNMIAWGANFAPYVTRGEYWRLFTANWLHFGIQHLLFNGYSLYALGRSVESLFGPRRFAVLYLLTGVSGALASYIFTDGLSAGASTALLGLFGALMVYFYRQREVIGNSSRAQLRQLVIVLIINVVFGFLPGSRIDNWGHAGGLLGGLMLGWFLCPRYVAADGVERGGGELATPYIVDANSLAKQWLVLLAFVGALVAVTLVVVMLRA